MGSWREVVKPHKDVLAGTFIIINYDIKYHGKTYFCDGVATNFETGECRVLIFQEKPVPEDDNWHDWSYHGKSRDDCMQAFLEVKYWDGKSFYEAAPEMTWM